jgi:hypothetical protein
MGSLVLPASSGKRLLLRDTYDSVAKRLARRSHRAEPIRNSGIEPNQALAALVGLVLVTDAAEREGPGYRLERLGADRDPDQFEWRMLAEPSPAPRPKAWRC